MPFGALYQLPPEPDSLLIEKSTGICPGDRQPSLASLSCFLTVVWGDIKTYQQIMQWQLAANLNTGWQRAAFSAAPEWEHSSPIPEQGHCNYCVQLLSLAHILEKTESTVFK